MLHPHYRNTVLEPLFRMTLECHATHYDRVNHAHLVMLCECGIITGENGGRLARALRDIETSLAERPPGYTGEYEDYYFLVEHELTARLGDIGGMLAVARSRNDTDHTVFRLWLQERAVDLFGRLLGLASKLHGKSVASLDTLIVGYTHGQPAQPTTFGHYLGAALETLIRDMFRLEREIEHLFLCPMGAAAITSTGFPVDRQRMADLLGFREPQLNAYGCIASVDYITGLYSAIKLIFLHLGRVVQDFGQWTSFELGQMKLPDSLVQVSSIMPQKRNPVPIEHLRHFCSTVSGMCGTMVEVMHNTPFTDMNDSEAEVQSLGQDIFARATRCLTLFETVIDQSDIDKSRVQEISGRACITVTELADTLVRTTGLDYRKAHGICSRTAIAASSAGIGLSDSHSEFSRAYRAVTGRDPGLTEKEFMDAVCPRHFIDRRDRPGGPAPRALQEALSGYERMLDELRGGNRSRICLKEDAAMRLGEAFAVLAGG